MYTITVFPNLETAADYRAHTGCGGWIFACGDGEAFLFPVFMTPSVIMMHPMTAGRNGKVV